MATVVLVASGVALAATKHCLINGDGTGYRVCNGSNYPDEIWGTKEADSIYGQYGGDIVYGGGGDDGISGGSNYDYYNPQANEKEYLNGDEGSDSIHGDEGSDYLSGGDGADRLSLDLETPGEDEDRADGGYGNDKIWEGIAPLPADPNTITQSWWSRNTLVGGEGNDYILANQGSESYVQGGVGSDTIEASGDHATDHITCGEDPDGQDVDVVYYDAPPLLKPDDVSGDCELLIATVLDDSFAPPLSPLPPPP
jgi:Ca2+-binding RTX toxin-like protein